MKDLIDRNALLSTIEDVKYFASMDSPKWKVTAKTIIDIIKRMETVEPETKDLQHGYWEKCKPDALIYWRCSACKNVHYLDEPRAAYCPGCGSKMDLGA